MKPVDIVITFDTTGSMFPCIAEVRRKIVSLTDDLFSKFDNLRIGVISHGDYCDAPYVSDMLSLTSEKYNIVQFIKNARNTSGGDDPECYEMIINMARHADFRLDAEKIVIMIGDATPHEVGYRDGLYTNYFNWTSELKLAQSDGIMFYAVQCLNRRESKSFWNSVAKLTDGKYIKLDQFNQIVKLLTLAVYAVHDEQMAQDYAAPLLMNRGFRQIAQSILSKSVMPDMATTYADKSGLVPVDPARFQRLHVDSNIGIKEFVNLTGATFCIGHGFYQLNKSELVQESKEVVLVDRTTGDMFSGDIAREMIGLPYGVRGKINPSFLSRELKNDYLVFVQSTSPNRKLMRNTDFLYEVNYK